MDASSLREQVEAEKQTELERLGSNKFLVALTDADLSADAVLRAAADSEHAAHVTFAGWAEDEEEQPARDLFDWVADREATHRERVLDAIDELQALDASEGAYEPNDGGTMHSYLRERETAVERVAAGLVGRPLVSVRAHLQIISHFVNGADEARADLFRGLRAETEEELARGLATLDDSCENEKDWETTRLVAGYVVQLAYDDYADSLQGLGVDVEPIC